MKQVFVTSVLCALLPGLGHAAADTYLNNDIVTVPPVIDATNFVNRGIFSFDSGTLFDFSSVRNFTNENVMQNGIPIDQLDPFGFPVFSFGNSGFRFDTAPPSLGGRYPAANFVNASQAGNPSTNARIYATSQLFVSATNIVSPGILQTSDSGLISLQGSRLDLSRGTLKSSSDSSLVYWDSYWGFGSNVLSPSFNFVRTYPNTPTYRVTAYPQNLPTFRSMYLSDVIGQTNSLTTAEFINEFSTNRTVQVVFVRNVNPEINVEIRGFGGSAFDLGLLAVRWSSAYTNDEGQLFTNSIYLTDDYGSFTTNFYYSRLVKSVYTTFQPQNFALSGYEPFDFTFGNPGVPFTDKPFDFWGTRFSVSNAPYSAWGALVGSSPDPVQTVPQIRGTLGRVEMTGSRSLDLNLARVEALNYIKVAATNHFAGSSNAFIAAPYTDVALRGSNGYLNVSSLLKPSLDRFAGTIDVYTVVWTNTVVFNGSTNPVLFNALVVDSALSNRVDTQILDLSLIATNITIADRLKIVNSFKLDTDWLTITTNAGLNMANSTGMVWRSSVPHIRGLTNHGEIIFPNNLYFAGTNANGTDRPLHSFFNAGIIQGSSITALATNFYNQGGIYSTAGPLLINVASNLNLGEGGIIDASLFDITLTARSLTISNHTIRAGRALTLAVTNRLDSGTNSWRVFSGFNLPVRPAEGDLAYSTILSTAVPRQSSSHTWSGMDRGAVAAGYVTNGAVGVLVLDGGTNSQFSFSKSGSTSNAIYVDRLELLNSAGRIDGSGNLSQLSINSGMTIYYAQALINGNPAAEFMDGKNGGRLRWVSGYAGPMSGTNVVYPDGTTNFLNAAVVSSCNLDSDGDGIVNCLDPSPVFLPQLAKVSVAVVNNPAPTVSLTWPTIAGASNKVYDKTNSSGSWRLLTNLISPAGSGTLTNQYSTPLGKGSRYFKVEVQLPQ